MLFELPRIGHVDAKSAEEAAAILQTHEGKAALLGGGTDLLALMKERIEGPKLARPEVLVNIKTVAEMGRIAEGGEGGLVLGAALTLRQIEASGIVKEKAGLLRQAAREVGTTQLRNAGTLGGNLCQRVRCAYFRHHDFVCLKKGGATCFAAAGEHRFSHAILNRGTCVAAHPSDMAPALVALKAVALVAGPYGFRRIPLEDFFAPPERVETTVLSSYELLFAVEVPHGLPGTRHVFLKERLRKAADFSLAAVALSATISGGTCEAARIVLGGVAPHPYVAAAAESVLLGKSPDEKTLSEAAEAALAAARPLPHNRYKVDLTRALVRRALTLAL